MFKLDHIGIVSKKIEELADVFRQLGLTEKTESVPFDPLKVTASFINVGKEDDVYLELLEPTEDNSAISGFIKKRGSGLHHLCFEVDNIEKVSEELKAKGLQMVISPSDCASYDINLNRECSASTKIAFFMTKNKLLIELIEKGV